ncbi:MAG TPA: hypothetical protein VNX68_19455 [Nitrosopumilaceae archaeon]|jgi:hypothetical protein|nr:hypothetical protein [Nitrosopumilaceae archaeon]
MIRDEEIQRLTNYIKGIGLKVTFISQKRANFAAAWYLDNSAIEICKNKNKTKIETILSLIHELGHALHNIHEKDRQVDTKFDGAISHVDKAEEEDTDTQKRQRKTIFDNEVAGAQYWHQIYKETNMKFAIWRLDAAMEYDIWNYEVHYETGDYPSWAAKKKKRKEVMNRYRNK